MAKFVEKHTHTNSTLSPNMVTSGKKITCQCYRNSQVITSLRTHRLHSPSDFRQTVIQPLGANPIILGLPLEEANFRLRCHSPLAAHCLRSDERMELELRDHIYQQSFLHVASLHAVNYADYKRRQPETRAFLVPRLPYLAYRLCVQWK